MGIKKEKGGKRWICHSLPPIDRTKPVKGRCVRKGFEVGRGDGEGQFISRGFGVKKTCPGKTLKV